MTDEAEESPSAPMRGVSWTAVAAGLCFAYGVAFTLNIHPIGDGLWFWYGRLYREHHLLYAEMHLPLQPLFVLLTAATQRLFGVSWLGSKMLAFAQAAALCSALWLIARRIAWREREKAVLVGAAFVFTLMPNIFRFDDYHVTSSCLEVFSLYLLLQLGDKEHSRAGAVSLSAVLGGMAGLTTVNRLNDGLTLIAGTGFVLFFAARRYRWSALATYSAGTLVAIAGVVLATGDGPREWWLNTFVRASAIKGGTGSILKGPIHFLKWQLRFNLLIPRTIFQAVLVGLLVLCAVRLRMGWYESGRQARVRRGCWGGLLVVVLALSARQPGMEWPTHAIAAYTLPFLIVMGGWVLWWIVQGDGTAGRNWRVILLIVPLMQLVATGITSHDTNVGIYDAIGWTFLLLPLAAPSFFGRPARRWTLQALACVVVCSGVVAKSERPYYWHHFSDRALFVDRVWYRHPLYGEMYVERDQLELTQKICTTVNLEGRPTGLLEITNPYANWFCDVPPWHGYVQTWYDTVSRETVEQLTAEMRGEPPQWIVYQRALDTMEMHEIIYNHAQPLPHRELDRLMMERLASGQWTLAYQQRFQDTDWMVIRTAPAVTAVTK